MTQVPSPTARTAVSKISSVGIKLGLKTAPNNTVKQNKPTAIKGGSSLTQFLASTSNQMPITVTESSVATNITATTTPATGVTGTTFTTTGTLKRSDTSVGLPSATVQLERSVSGSSTWTPVTGKTAVTTTAGTFTITNVEPTAGSFIYRISFAGATL